MNLTTEAKNLLERMKEKGLIGIKSELESEGIRIEELIILNSMVNKSGLKSGLKIGGAEAKLDMYVATNTMSDWVIAPMIESGYAARKCVEAYTNIKKNTPLNMPKLCINIETLTSLQNIREICDELKNLPASLVFGRVDFTLSNGLSRGEIGSELINKSVLSAAEVAKEYDYQFVVGGGINVASIPLLKQIKDIRLDRFETRKCIIDANALDGVEIEELLKDCVLFELLWLKIKSQYYNFISKEDDIRIAMLEQRHLYNLRG